MIQKGLSGSEGRIRAPDGATMMEEEERKTY
jgi:hypothetical protein